MIEDQTDWNEEHGDPVADPKAFCWWHDQLNCSCLYAARVTMAGTVIGCPWNHYKPYPKDLVDSYEKCTGFRVIKDNEANDLIRPRMFAIPPPRKMIVDLVRPLIYGGRLNSIYYRLRDIARIFPHVRCWSCKRIVNSNNYKREFIVIPGRFYGKRLMGPDFPQIVCSGECLSATLTYSWEYAQWQQKEMKVIRRAAKDLRMLRQAIKTGNLDPLRLRLKESEPEPNSHN